MDPDKGEKDSEINGEGTQKNTSSAIVTIVRSQQQTEGKAKKWKLLHRGLRQNLLGQTGEKRSTVEAKILSPNSEMMHSPKGKFPSHKKVRTRTGEKKAVPIYDWGKRVFEKGPRGLETERGRTDGSSVSNHPSQGNWL